MSPFHGVIIAGGQGRRLGGVCKANLRIAGVRLIELVAARLAQAEPPLMVSTGPGEALFELPPGCFGVRDLPTGIGGPLAGVAAAVAHLRDAGVVSGVLLSVAVDTPFLPQDYAARLLEGLGDGPAVFAAWGQQFYPPNAAWRLEAIADLPERSAERGSLKALQRLLGGQRVGWDECTENPFDNVNTPEDLIILGKRAERLGRL